MSEENTNVVVEPEATTTPVVEEPKEFGEMSVDERVSYVQELRKQAGVVTEPETKQVETPVVDEVSPVIDDAGKAVEPETVTPKTEEPEDWRNAEVQGLAEAYGIDAGRLAKIPSREVLDVLLDSLEHNPMAQVTEPVREVKQTQENKPEPVKDLEEFSLTNNDELSIEDAPKLIEKIRKQDQELREIREWKAQQEQAVIKQFIDGARSRVIESAMKAYPEFYGEPGKPLTKEMVARHDDLWKAHFDRAALIERRGGKPNESIEFVKRSIADVHGDLILSKIEKKQERLEKLITQSSRVTGGGSTKDLPTSGATPLEKNLAKLSQRLRSLGVAGT
jgi:polyhydroxyalkanoate synthesis regulator phasin